MAYYAVIDGEIEDQVASNRGLSQLYDAMEAHGGDACMAFIETGRTDDVVSLASEMALIQSTPPVMTTIAGMIELMRGVDSFGISDGTEASDNREMEELDDDDSTIVENDGDSDDPDDDDLSLSDCGANGPDGGGFQKGNDCAKGGGVKASDGVPDDWDGDIEFVGEDGEVLGTQPASEARENIKAALEQGYDLSGSTIRQSTKETRQAEKDRMAKIDAERTERIAREQEAKRLGNRPGGDEWKEPPERLYHATFAADDIVKEGFRTASQLGEGSDVLGGSNRDAVSFTDKATAEAYRDGLEVARNASQGRISPDDTDAMNSIASQFGVSESFVSDRVGKSKGDDSQRMFDILQAISFEGEKFPLFVGGSWPRSLKESSSLPTIVSIETPKGLGENDISYHKSENEWKISNVSKLGKPRKE